MRGRARLTDVLDAAASVIRHPERAARTVLYLGRDDGNSLSWLFRRALSPEARRRLAADLLRHDAVVLEFAADGFEWRVPTGDEVTSELLAAGEYTAREVERLRAWFTAQCPGVDGTVIEVGANLGTSTLPLVRAGWQVVALEPVPQTFGFLVENVARNVSSAVTCRCVAASDHAGTAVMSVTQSLAISKILDDDAHTAPGDRVEVPVDTLDSIASAEGLAPADVAFVWCDAEGHESRVMRGGAGLWAWGVPLYAECGPPPESDEFVAEARRHFTSFVPGADIESVGPVAESRGIDTLGAYLATCQRLTNVLLLPTPTR